MARRPRAQLLEDLARDRDADVGADEPFLELLEQRGVDRAALEQAAQLARQGRAAAIQARAQPAEEAAPRLGSDGVVRRCFGHGGILAHAVGFAPMGATRQGAARPAQRDHARGTQARRLRIIAGRWRGRRWQFPEGDIRPTSDRVRETLFNWLQGRIDGRRCLDLYAGSGALGLEALSRGAARCTFVDSDARAIDALSALLHKWGAAPGSARLEHSDAAQFLARAAEPMDLVFLDPPFAATTLAAAAAQLEARGWLAPAGLVYLEHPRSAPLAGLPAELAAAAQRYRGRGRV